MAKAKATPTTPNFAPKPAAFGAPAMFGAPKPFAAFAQPIEMPALAPATKNGYIRERSSLPPGGICAAVHELADALYAEDPGISNKDIIAACREQGIAYGTARTQCSHWRRDNPRA